MRRIAVLIFPVTLFLGCNPDEERVSESVRNVVAGNGTEINGTEVNGTEVNGTEVNGTEVNGTEINGTEVNGTEINGLSLNGSYLSATLINGTVIGGSDLVGSTFDSVTVDGQTIRLRVDSFSQGTGSNTDVYYYGISWRDSPGWSPVCPNGALAIATYGRWNYGQGVSGGGSWTADWNFITWSCQVSAITKCVELGYKPWKWVGNASLQTYHQACTRMIRADYCGNGTPYTVDGTLINLYDALGIQLDTQNWSMEAEWDANGAKCMTNKTRSTVAVPCQSSKQSNSCGSNGHFNSGTLLMSEIQ